MLLLKTPVGSQADQFTLRIEESHVSYRHYAGIAYFSAERYAEGTAREEQTLRERPNVPTAMRFLVACKAGVGRIGDAHAVIAELLNLALESSERRQPSVRVQRAWTWCYSGHPSLCPAGQPAYFIAWLAALVPTPRLIDMGATIEARV